MARSGGRTDGGGAGDVDSDDGTRSVGAMGDECAGHALMLRWWALDSDCRCRCGECG